MLRYILLSLLFTSQIIPQTTYYVSQSGNDSNNGLTPSTAWKTVGKVNAFSFSAGDVIRFKGGDKFTDTYLETKSGLPANPIKYSRYGTGLPIIGDPTGNWERTILIQSDHDVTIDSLKVFGSGVSSSNFGIQLYDVKNIRVTNCLVEGGSGSRGNDNARGIVCYDGENVVIDTNEVAGWCSGMEFNGVKPLDVGYNEVHNITSEGELASGIRVIGNMTSGGVYNYNYEAVIHHNNIYDFKQFGADGARGANIIFEYNHVHDCKTNGNGSGGGFKVGAWGDQTDYSYGNIFRYNVINDLWAPQYNVSPYDWKGYAFWGEDCPDAIIYGNLVYNIYGPAIARVDNNNPDPNAKYLIYNNTFITGSSAIQLWGGGNSPAYVWNNIIKSGVQVPGHSYAYSHPRNSIEENRTWHGTDPFNYPKIYDLRYDGSNGRYCYVDANIFVKDESLFNPNNSSTLYNGTQKANLFQTDPLFNNESNNDYSLKDNSPGINYGLTSQLIVSILDNTILNMHDLGAIKVGSSSNTGIKLNTKIFLEGPYNDGNMSTGLSTEGDIPLNQPYNENPWNYAGTESVSSIPLDVVDWVLIELRSGTASSSIVASKAAFVKSDGSVVDLDGVSQVNLKGVPEGNYYVVVMHRNHIPVMSANAIPLSSNSALYDFTTSSSKAYGIDAMADLGGGKWGLYAGDSDRNGTVNVLDYGEVVNFLLDTGYKYGDLDLNGVINVLDYSKTNSNLFKSSQVPN